MPPTRAGRCHGPRRGAALLTGSSREPDHPGQPDHPDLPDNGDDLDGVETPLSRFARHGRRWIAALVALGLLVPGGIWLVDEVRFRTSGSDVVQTLDGELEGVDIAETVLLVRTTGCAPGTDASGSAFVVSTGAGPALITNRHVVENARQVTVRGIRETAGVPVAGVRISETADVAVLELADPEDLPPALALRRGAPALGEDIRLIGFPAAIPSTDAGTVADVSATRLILDLEVGRGASGSPVVDDDGRVVGQVFAVNPEGYGIATPAARVLDAIDDSRPLDPC